MPLVTPSNSENKPGISKGTFALTRSSFSVPNEVPEEPSTGFWAIRRYQGVSTLTTYNKTLFILV